MRRALLPRFGGSPPPPILPPSRAGGEGRRGGARTGRGAGIFPHSTRPSGWVPAAAAAVIAMTGLSGCVSLDTAAPAPATVLASPRVPRPGLPDKAPADSATLALGRDLYVGRCAKCHAVEPVRDYSPAEWATLMPDMAERTKLTAAETAAVTAYVHAVLRMPP